MSDPSESAQPACTYLVNGHMMASTEWQKTPQEPAFSHLTSVCSCFVGFIPYLPPWSQA
jgi:hypothetical protein